MKHIQVYNTMLVAHGNRVNPVGTSSFLLALRI